MKTRFIPFLLDFLCVENLNYKLKMFNCKSTIHLFSVRNKGLDSWTLARTSVQTCIQIFITMHCRHAMKPKLSDDDHIFITQKIHLFLYAFPTIFFLCIKHTFFHSIQIYCFIGNLKCAHFHCSLPKFPNKGFGFNKHKRVLFCASWGPIACATFQTEFQRTITIKCLSLISN